MLIPVMDKNRPIPTESEWNEKKTDKRIDEKYPNRNEEKLTEPETPNAKMHEIILLSMGSSSFFSEDFVISYHFGNVTLNHPLLSIAKLTYMEEVKF